jgi:hypothetical protein
LRGWHLAGNQQCDADNTEGQQHGRMLWSSPVHGSNTLSGKPRSLRWFVHTETAIAERSDRGQRLSLGAAFEARVKSAGMFLCRSGSDAGLSRLGVQVEEAGQPSLACQAVRRGQEPL